jgi:4-diphosphocytidyl-2-C-methyl-D-erythritol kinase
MISIFDTLTFKQCGSGIVFKTNQKNLPLDGDNFVVKAAKLILQEAEIKQGVEIFLEKNIPIGAGLGGGSSNAAFTLIGLNNFFQLNLRKKDLFKMALKIGSDVPFFLYGPTALGRGRGEILTSLKLKKHLNLHILVVFPGLFVSTRSVYEDFNFGLTSNSKDNSILALFLENGEIAESGLCLINDLEVVVCKKYPILSKIKKKLVEFGAIGALVSGSGSSVFGLFLQQETAQKAVEKLKMKDWQVFLAKTID